MCQKFFGKLLRTNVCLFSNFKIYIYICTIAEEEDGTEPMDEDGTPDNEDKIKKKKKVIVLLKKCDVIFFACINKCGSFRFH